tara:strand:- start:197 stop:400 length:204 start_codon:yes stop_codon:yes gene_type:complete
MNTTISISKENKKQIMEFGNKGETYDEILGRVLNSAKERQLQELLMDEKDTISVRDALDEAKRKWQE